MFPCTGTVLRAAALFGVSLCLASAAAYAQNGNGNHRNYISLSIENDSLGDGSDRYYTNGARLSWFNLQTPVPEFIRTLDEYVPPFRINDTTSTMFSLGQNMFTPEDIENPQEQPDDRPWAAWTYGSVALATRTANHIDQMEFTLGIVGPEALGEQAQKLVHRHFADAPTPKGWRHQLDFEPGVILSWQRRWPEAARWVVGEYAFRAVPNVNASVGNIYTYAGTGLSFTFGPNHSQQDTPPRVRPSMPGTGYFETPQAGWNWQIFASLDGRAVARNIFLDGNSFRDGPSVDKKPLVGDASAGISFTLGDYRLSYSINTRSPEFDGQGAESIYGALTLTARF